MAEKKIKTSKQQQTAKKIQPRTPSSNVNNVVKKTPSSVSIKNVNVRNVAKFDKLESLNFGRVLSIKDGIVTANA